MIDETAPPVRVKSEPGETYGCPKCGLQLDLHQPDGDRADRLVGICHDCDTWYLLIAEGDDALAVALPSDLGVRIAAA